MRGGLPLKLPPKALCFAVTPLRIEVGGHQVGEDLAYWALEREQDLPPCSPGLVLRRVPKV